MMMMSGPVWAWIGCRDARLDVVLVDPLDLDLHARLLSKLGRLLVEEDVRRLDEVRPLQQVEPCPSRRGGRLGVRQDAPESAGRDRAPSPPYPGARRAG